jgi:hypothetical protein
LISFLWPKLFLSPIDLHSLIWFPRLAGPSSFRLLRDFGICSVSLYCSVRSSFGSAWSLSDRVGSVRSSLGSAWSLSDRVGSLSDHHLAHPGLYPFVSGLCPIVPGLCPIVPGLCPIVVWLSWVSVRSCRVSVRSSFCSASFFVWCVAGLIHSVICFSGRVLSLISHVVFLAPFWVSGAVLSTVPRADS